MSSVNPMSAVIPESPPGTGDDELIIPAELFQPGRTLYDILSDDELFWRDSYTWLKGAGYLLRPRYQPSWTPPWRGDNPSKKRASDWEESALLWHPDINDATRISDESRVAIKRSKRLEVGASAAASREVNIFRRLASEPLASDPQNYCVRAIEILRVPDEIHKHQDLIIMPLLMQWDRYPLSTVGEVLDLFTQALEGIQFLHNHNIWHGDCKYNNIMMEASPILRDDPHPWSLFHTRDYSARPLPGRSRTRYPVKYYWIDFDLSDVYDPSKGPPLTEPGYGGLHGVPEWAFPERMCNPFAVDIWCLGYTFRGYFTEACPGFSLMPPYEIKGFEFMHELLADMCLEDPTKRPTIDEVVDRFSRIKAEVSEWRLRSRFKTEKRFFLLDIIHATGHWIRQIQFALMHLPAIPSP
ncbi:kinase-like domain-containing protein [Mycena vitilis]|nr:kinase-like domain-containing protein [Mycena vitilis]